MDIVGLLLEASRRITAFIRREVLGVFLPGLMTFFGIVGAVTIPQLPVDAKTPADVMSAWVRLVVPHDRLAQFLFLLVSAYFAFGVGQISRMAVFWFVFRKNSDSVYLQELKNAWRSLETAFGAAEVERVFSRHGLARGLTVLVEGDRPDMGAPSGGATMPDPTARSAGNTRIEFNYCKLWLSTSGSKLATGHFEDTINLLSGMTVPFTTVAALIAEYVCLALLPGRLLLQLVVVVVWVVVVLFCNVALVGEVRKQQGHENFDTLKHFFFQNWIDALAMPQSPDETASN